MEAVDEVGNPTILATFAVIAAILPMAFVRGLMGPYMRPIPVGASAAMMFSLMWPSSFRPGRRCGCCGITPHRLDSCARSRRLDHPSLPPNHDAADRRTRQARTMFLGGMVVLLLLALRSGAAQAGAREDAAVRQQERVPGHHRHAERHHAGADHAGCAGAGTLPGDSSPK